MARILLIALVLIALSGNALASQDRVFSVTVDNDVLTPEDRWFTNGVRVSVAFGEAAQKPWMDRLADKIPFLSKTYNRRIISFSLGQNMYTPDDTKSFALVSDDRPYAGWLYGELALEADGDKTVDYFSLQAGVIGPASLADRTQRSYHKLIGSSRPNGWPNQLKTEPGLVVAYQRVIKAPLTGPGAKIRVTLDPHMGLALGNVYTYGAAGLTLRLGQGFEGENGPPPRISPALPGSNYFKGGGFAWYLFAALEGRAVARDIFLDGNTFAAGHSVAKKHLVADFQLGLVLIMGGVRVSYTHVFRTREFALQPETHEFSSLNVAFRF